MYGLTIKTRQPNLRKLQFSQSSTVFDSRDFIGGDIADVDRFIDSLPTEDWDDQATQTFTEMLSSDDPLLALGFYELEEWGVWSRTSSPILVLPFFVSGQLELTITAMGYGLNIDREITVTIGNASAKIMLTPNLRKISIVLDITSPSRKVEFGDIMALTVDDIKDPRTMGIGISHLSITSLSRDTEPWNGAPIFVDLANDEIDQLRFAGFYEREQWGIWSMTKECYIALPNSVHGSCEIQMFAQSFGQNSGRELSISLGDSLVRFVVEEEPRQYIFRFNPSQPSNLLTISGLSPDSTTTDSRTLGIGIHRLQMTRPPEAELVPAKKMKIPQIKKQPKVRKRLEKETYSLQKHEEVYSALFSDTSRTNEWRDVVSAFIWNFREDKDAVLLVKNSNASAAFFFSELMFLFYRVGGMKCRIIAIHTHDLYSDIDSIILASNAYIHTDGSVSPELGFDKIKNTEKISIVSAFDQEKFSGRATVLIKPNRQPKRIRGSLFGIEKELEYILDWERLVHAFHTAHELLQRRTK